MIVKFKARRLWVVATLALVALPAGYAGTSAANGSGAMKALIADPSSVFSARSPGGRGAGALAQTKLAYVRTGPATDEFLGLGPEIDGPVADDITRLDEPGTDAGLGGGAAALPIPTSLYGPSDSGPFYGGSGGGLPPGDGGGFGFGAPAGGGSPGGGGGGGGFTPGGTGTTPPAPVPEPDMWLMLIAGFFAIGSATRAGNRRAAGASL